MDLSMVPFTYIEAPSDHRGSNQTSMNRTIVWLHVLLRPELFFFFLFFSSLSRTRLNQSFIVHSWDSHSAKHCVTMIKSTEKTILTLILTLTASAPLLLEGCSTIYAMRSRWEVLIHRIPATWRDVEGALQRNWP